MKIKHLLIVLTLPAVLSSCLSKKNTDPSVVGLWAIKLVTVGGDTMTPTGKWMRILPNGEYHSGNGWRQHTIGNWMFDEQNGTIALEATNNLKDSYPAFSVKLDGDRMIWNRVEDGNEVTVSLETTEELPQTPADRVQGLWKLTPDTEKVGETLYLRWDNVYVRTRSGKRERGYWQMHAHRPEITLISNDPGNSTSKWKVSVTQNDLFLHDIVEKKVLIFKRSFEF